jgi:hypothetical protein
MTDDHDGSRWYFPIFEGLVDAKHQEQMGSALWLYLYCVKYAFVARQQGALRYNHIEAAEELGASQRTVKRWFEILQQHGYITTSARKRYHLEVAISNWRAIEEWLEARQREGGTSPPIGNDTTQDTRSVTRSAISAAPYILSISLSGYIYPNGSHGDAANLCLADAFRGLIEELKNKANRPAILRRIYQLCFGGDEETLPDYGYLGKVAKAVGGAERLAMLMWEMTTRPAVDPLPYILKSYGENAKGNQHATRKRSNQADGASDLSGGSLSDDQRAMLAKFDASP